MPSPISHSLAGYVLYRVFRKESTEARKSAFRLSPALLLTTVTLSLLPDLDSAAGILAGDFGAYHNNVTHSLIVGLGVAVLVGGGVHLVRGKGFLRWFLITLLAYEIHIIMDFFTVGRGVMALWPFTSERFLSPLPLFYGVHWSDGLLSLRHLWTILTEIGLAILIAAALVGYTHLKQRRRIFPFVKE